jgi:hypothetical protein
VVVVTPGFLRSEWMLDHFGVTEANWRDAAKKVKEFIIGRRQGEQARRPWGREQRGRFTDH